MFKCQPKILTRESRLGIYIRKLGWMMNLLPPLRYKRRIPRAKLPTIHKCAYENDSSLHTTTMVTLLSILITIPDNKKATKKHHGGREQDPNTMCIYTDGSGIHGTNW